MTFANTSSSTCNSTNYNGNNESHRRYLSYMKHNGKSRLTIEDVRQWLKLDTKSCNNHSDNIQNLTPMANARANNRQSRPSAAPASEVASKGCGQDPSTKATVKLNSKTSAESESSAFKG